MALPEICPDAKRLDAWLSGSLPDAERESLVAHLDACVSCREKLDRLVSAAEILGGLTPGAGDAGGLRGPALPGALASLKGELPLNARSNQTTEHAPAAETTVESVPRARGESPRQIGPYTVIERVGRGGMGEVFRAMDAALDRVVAVKILAPAMADNPEARRRFLREARAAAAVCHEHVVTIHAVDDSGELPYLIMQFVAGRSLQEKLDRDGPLGLKEILRIGMQVASGLAAAHAQGLVHRDIKPANILLENGVERVKITDFGLARAASDPGLTRSGTIVGTPNYMSPEQARGEAVGPRSDLFSLGGVLYAMATGEPPFAADSAYAVVRRVCEDTPRPIRELNPECPDWLAATIGRLMAKSQEARFATAEEVSELLRVRLAELQGPMTSGLVPARSSGSKSRPWGKWVALALASLVAFGGVIAGVVRFWPARRAETTRVRQSGPAPSAAGLARGWEYAKAEDWHRALAEFDAAVGLAADDAAAREARAFARLKVRDFRGAIADCDEALRLNPGLSNAYFHRGLAFNELGEWGRGRAELDEFIRRVPSEPWSHYHRATSRHNLGDLDGAVADFDVAIELNSEVPLFYGERALALAMRGEPGTGAGRRRKGTAIRARPPELPAPAGLGSGPPRRI